MSGDKKEITFRDFLHGNFTSMNFNKEIKKSLYKDCNVKFNFNDIEIEVSPIPSNETCRAKAKKILDTIYQRIKGE